MKKRSRGFTLAEVLIVVAIIAVLVAIAIPVFTSQLEKARQATDLANIRSAYAAAVAGVVTTGTDASAEAGKMKHTGLFNKLSSAEIGDRDLKTETADDAAGAVVKGTNLTVTVDTTGHVTLSGGAGSGGSSGSGGGEPISLTTPLTDAMKEGATIARGIHISPLLVETGTSTASVPSTGVIYYYTRGNSYVQTDGGKWYYWDGSAWSYYNVA